MVTVLDEGHCYICGKSPCVIWVGQRGLVGTLVTRIGFCGEAHHREWERLPLNQKWLIKRWE